MITHHFSIILLLIVGQAFLCHGNSAWNCSNYYANRTVTYTRSSYCYTSVTAESLEGKDPLLMNASTSRTSSEKVEFCAKAAVGRGFRTFSLFDGKCFASRSLSYFTYYYCSYSSITGCTNGNGYPCTRYLTSSCKCGTTHGYGASNYYNSYAISQSESTLGLWIEIDDIFNNTVQMFNKTAPEYIYLQEKYKTAIETYLNDSKICGIPAVREIFRTTIRPKNGFGPILVRLQLAAISFDMKSLHEKLKALPYQKLNVTEFRTVQILGQCSDGANVMSLTVDGSNSLTSPIKYSREGFNIGAHVHITCIVPLLTLIDIKIANISKDGHISNFTTLCNYSLSSVTSKYDYCSIAPFTFSEGIYYVMGEASTPQDPTMYGFDHSFINVTRGPVYAHISTEKTTCLHVMGLGTYLNGTESYDKNLFQSALEAYAHPNDLKYIWICYKSGEVISATTPDQARQLTFVEKGISIPGRTGGCFGSGPGRLRATTRTTYFDTSSLASGDVIYFMLFVEKGDRYARTTKKCTVVPAPERFYVRCRFNCGTLMKTTSRLGIEPVCDNPAGCSVTLKHSWKFFVFTGRFRDVGEGKVEPIWEPFKSVKTLTGSKNIYIVVDELNFEQNRTYRAQHTVTNVQNGWRETNYNFTTNILPHSGTCESDKTTLQAGLDTVKISCSGWIDEQSFLSYEAWILPHNTEPRLVYFGNSSSFSLRLPVGDSTDSFRLELEIKIFDIYESTSFFINLTVTEPDVEDPVNALTDLLDENDEDEQEKAQKGIATLSLLENSFGSDISSSNKTNIRDSIISMMSNVSANSTETINQVTGVLIDSTSKKDELSSEGQMQAIKSASSMSETLQKDNSTDDPAVFEQVGTILLHLIGNVIDGAASTNVSELDNTMSHSKLLGETALNTSDTISSTLIGKMMGGEKSKTFLTPPLGLEISKTESDKLPKSYGVKGGGIKVPPVMTSLIGSTTKCSPNETCVAADTFVSTKVLFYNSNLYTWGNGSIKVNSPVISLEYLTNKGDTISVGGIDSEFEIKIPTKPPPKPNTEEKFPNFITPDADCAMHKFYINNNDTAFETIISLEQETFVTLFVRYGQRPSEKDYDVVFHHPNLSSCVEPPERDNCTGVVDFTECMGLNRTSWKLNETRCDNVTVPGVEFLSNTSIPRDNETCIDYHNAVTCPPLECSPNGTGNSSNLNSNQTSASGSSGTNNTSGNSTTHNPPTVCNKVKDFLYCKNASLVKYESCKEWLTKKKLIYGKYEKCSENIYRKFFGLDVFRKAGWYYVSICYPARQKHIPTTPKPTTPMPTTAVPTTEIRQVNHTNSSNNTQGGNNDSRRRFRWVWERRRRDRKKRSFNIDNLDWIMDDDIMPRDKEKLNDNSDLSVIKEKDRIQEGLTTYDSRKEMEEKSDTSTSVYLTDKESYNVNEIKLQREANDKVGQQTRTFGSDEKGQELSTSKDEENEYDDFLDSEEETLYSIDGKFDMDTQARGLSRSRRETTQRKCAVVDEKPPPTTPPPPTDFPPVRPQVFNASISLNYSFDINLFTCLFWNGTTESWSTNGCKPHINSTPTSLVCMCNHLTSFGADMLVAPNPIDFDTVFTNFANLGETGNFSVLFTVIGLFLLYALAIVIARKADKRDVLVVSKTKVGSIDPSRGGYNYEISVSTGTFRGAGTTANVAFTIVGEKGRSQTIPLVDENGSSGELLSRGNVAYFVVNTPEDIGDIIYIRIWHNNKGEDPAWFMRQITIRDVVSNKTWLFIHNGWFAVDRADGKIDRRIYVASESEKSNFKTLFYSHTSKSFSDNHLWISVVLRSPSSPFTRVQRVTCCFSLLLCAMLANAMFYQNGESAKDTFEIGPIKLSLKEVIIGIESGLIVAPINLLIITLFRKARAKNKVINDERDENQEKNSSLEAKELIKESNNKSNKESNKESTKENPKSKKAKKRGLPHWCMYIAYFLCVISVLTAPTFVIFYSMMWGTEKSNSWITSVILSIVQDILVLQPMKIVILAMILSAIFRKSPEEDADNNTSTEQQEPQVKDDSVSSNEISLIEMDPYQYEPLDSSEVSDAKKYQTRKSLFKSSLKEIVWHLLFVCLLSVAVFGSHSSHRYRLHDHLNKVFYKTEKVTLRDRFWWWCETILLPGLYNNHWYNGQNFTDEIEGFISNKKAFLISMPRIRQARVQEEECMATKDYPKLREMFPKCYSDYTMSKADDSSPSTSLNPQGSVSLNDSVLNGEIGFERICLQPFMVQSAEKLGTLPVVTNDATYSGSAMVADLGYDNFTAKEVILNLKADKWISRQTRALFVEFVVFEPTSQLYAFTRISFEQKSVGSMFPLKAIEIYTLYGTGEASFDSLILVAQYLLILFILICLVKEFIKILKLKISYFKDPWNIHELVMLGFAIGMVAFIFLREVYVRKLIRALQENPYSRMSFDYVQYGTDIWNTMASVVVFLETLKLLKLLNFNKKILTFAQVIKLSKPFLVSYAFFFCVVFFAFAQSGNLIFGQQLIMYSTVVRSFVNVFQMALGKGLFYHDLKDIATTLGPVFILCYFLVTTLLLVNFFVSILNDSYADGCKKIEDENNEDVIMAAFMSAYIKSSLRDISKDLKTLQKKSRNKRVSGKEEHNEITEEEKKKMKLKEEASFFLY